MALAVAVPQNIALDVADLPWLRQHGEAVSFAAAHRELTRLRDQFRDTDTIEVDLTEEEFHWRGWIAGHPLAEELIGPGVRAFSFIRLTTGDSNLNEARADFLLRRVDGWDVRLHPQTTRHRVTGRKEALPVWGHYSDQWHADTHHPTRNQALASSRGQSSTGPTAGPSAAYVGMSQADTIGTREACRFLNRKVEEWTALGHPRGPFRSDLTDCGEFTWPYYVQGRAWYNALGDSRIVEFGFAWSDLKEAPVFVGKLDDGRDFQVHARKNKLEWGLEGVNAEP